VKFIEIIKNGGKGIGRKGPDELDLRLLELLQHNPRATYAELAEKIGLSRDGIKYRIARLEKRGIVKGYALQLDYSLLGLSNTSLLNVGFVSPEAGLFGELLEFMRGIGVVVSACRTLGNFDCQLQLATRDNEHLNELLQQVKGEFSGKLKTIEVVPVAD
jgi:Lrp/AsnC family transcriptional regulator, leucine-responsive regulatory protein